MEGLTLVYMSAFCQRVCSPAAVRAAVGVSAVAVAEHVDPGCCSWRVQGFRLESALSDWVALCHHS